MTIKPRIAYIGHHGSTRLYLKIHKEFLHQAVTDVPAGFITFNRYWKDVIHAEMPSAHVSLWPNHWEWAWHRWKKTAAKDEPDANLLRAWKIDKILRHLDISKVAALWHAAVDRSELFIKTAAPDYIVTELMQSLPCYALYTVCRRRKIPFIQLAGSRLEGRMDIYLDENGWPAGLQTGENTSPEALAAADLFCSRILDKRYAGPSYMKMVTKRKHLIRRSDLQKGFRYLHEQLRGGFWEPTSPPFLHPFVSKIRSWRIKKSFEENKTFKKFSDIEKIDGPKLLFPLHITPEASTDVWAPTYSDMLLTVRSILQYLPEEWTLVIKEHPASGMLQRDPREIEAFRTMKRVIYLSPQTVNDDLFAACQAIVVVNSTMGLEAIIKGYPIITLGKPFYDASGNTIPCPNIAELSDALKESARFHIDVSKTRNFVANYYDASAEGWAINPDMVPEALNPSNVSKIAHSLARRFFTTPATLTARLYS